MARRHGGLGRGLDALIPMREEVEKAMKSVESEGVEILFADDEEEEPKVSSPERVQAEKSVEEAPLKIDSVIEKKEENVSRETFEETDKVEVEKKEPEKPVKSVKDEKASDDLKYAVTVRISEVEPNREQPRKNFDDEKLEELAESIKMFGLLQPILVQKRDDHYEIIAGERRWRAALKAGLKEIPVIIRDYTEKEILELSLIENLQRENLNPIEEASRSAVANSLRLLKLEENVQKMVIDGQLSMGHARALLPLEIPEEQLSVAQEIVEKQLSVRETEKKVKEILNTGNTSETTRTKTGEQEEDPSIAIIYKQIEERLQQNLHTKVSIQRKRNGHGKLLIDFYNSDDLEKIIDRLTDH